MNDWCLDDGGGAEPSALLPGLIDAIGRDHFAASSLRGLRRALGVSSWSVYRLRDDRPPVMHLSGSEGVHDATGECFAIYRDRRLYACDSSFAAARRHAAGRGPVMLQMTAEEAPSAEHREAIYHRHGMLERLSVARTDPDGSLLAVNIYRHTAGTCAGSVLAERFSRIAPALIAAVARHLEWIGDVPARSARDALRDRCPSLTGRELDVLDRLLKGVTYDGIAADMGLGVSTVRTYRARAYERLGIHFKSQLFALVWGKDVSHPYQ